MSYAGMLCKRHEQMGTFHRSSSNPLLDNYSYISPHRTMSMCVQHIKSMCHKCYEPAFSLSNIFSSRVFQSRLQEVLLDLSLLFSMPEMAYRKGIYDIHDSSCLMSCVQGFLESALVQRFQNIFKGPDLLKGSH